MSIYHVCLELDKTGIYEWLNYKQPNDIKINEITIFSVKTKWYKNKWNNNLFVKKKKKLTRATLSAWLRDRPFSRRRTAIFSRRITAIGWAVFANVGFIASMTSLARIDLFFVPWTGRDRCAALPFASLLAGRDRVLLFFFAVAFCAPRCHGPVCARDKREGQWVPHHFLRRSRFRWACCRRAIANLFFCVLTVIDGDVLLQLSQPTIRGGPAEVFVRCRWCNPNGAC